ncbi:MAG: hypothetical protein ACI9KE_002479 [Polyangiales bacterium]|jgi:hypothetical protein
MSKSFLIRSMLVASLSLVLSGDAVAQISVSITLTTDRASVPVGGMVRLVARVDANGVSPDNIVMPSLEGFVVRSRHISRPMQVQFGFGGNQRVMSSQMVQTLILEATRPGRFELQPASVNAGGRQYTSQAVTIEVTGQGVPQQQTQNVTPTAAVAGGDGYVYDDQAFLRTTVSDANPFVGQQVDVALFLYVRVRIRSPNVLREPSAEGFWVQDLLPVTRTLEARPQTINGARFDAYEIRRFAAFPLREGELTIGAADMEVTTGGGIADLFNGGPRTPTLQRSGTPLTLQVRALPEPVPSNVLVGNATLDVRLDREQVRTGDAVTLTATIRGTGNLRDLRFAFPEVDGLRALRPSVNDSVISPGGRVGGERTFEWLVVPERPGRHTLPVLTFHTFNPATERYAEVRGAEIVMEAAGNAIEQVETTPDVDEPETPAVTNIAFEGLRPTSELLRAQPRFGQTPIFWGFLAFPPFLFALVLGVRALRRRTPDVEKTNRKRQRQRLDDASKSAQAGDARAFYAAISKALVDALETKTGEKIGSLTQTELHDFLIANHMPSADVSALAREMETCDFARFSSAGSTPVEMKDCLARTETILRSVDSMEANS